MLVQCISYDAVQGAVANENRILSIPLAALQITVWLRLLLNNNNLAAAGRQALVYGRQKFFFRRWNQAVCTLCNLTFPLCFLDQRLERLVESSPVYPRAYVRKSCQRLWERKWEFLRWRRIRHRPVQAKSEIELRAINAQKQSQLCKVLPLELYVEIARYVCHTDMIALGRTCRALRHLLMPESRTGNPSAPWRSLTCIPDGKECYACLNYCCSVSSSK